MINAALVIITALGLAAARTALIRRFWNAGGWPQTCARSSPAGISRPRSWFCSAILYQGWAIVFAAFPVITVVTLCGLARGLPRLPVATGVQHSALRAHVLGAALWRLPRFRPYGNPHCGNPRHGRRARRHGRGSIPATSCVQQAIAAGARSRSPASSIVSSLGERATGISTSPWACHDRRAAPRLELPGAGMVSSSRHDPW